MAWPQSLPNLSDTLSYFDKYDYPLTEEEIRYWSSIPLPPPPSNKNTPTFISPYIGGETRGGKPRRVLFKNGFYFLSSRQKLVKLRKQREKFSKPKWVIAYRQAAKLAKLPFIAAIFVTGALAMNNCPQDDDIDLMIITYPNTLWITRFFVVIYLKFFNLRRFPSTMNHELITNNRICDNLWLDLKNLSMNHEPTNHEHSLYIAHEILQAKCIFDRGGVHNLFLKQNSWVKKYLPVAYKDLTLGPSPEFRRGKPQRGEVLLKFLNSIFFIIQYLYMKPKMTTERVGLGFAFFHPNVNIRN